jgi:hypothetical protein
MAERSPDRTLNIAILASNTMVEAVRREDGGGTLGGFRDLGDRELRGREGLLRVWGRQPEG